MAFTAVQQPNQKQEESALDKVIKGLQVATSVFNIPVTLEHYKSLGQEREQKQASFEQQQAQIKELDTPTSKSSLLIKAASDAQLGAIANSEFGKTNEEMVSKLQTLVNDPATTGRQAAQATESFMKTVVPLATKEGSIAAQIIKAQIAASTKDKISSEKNPTAAQSAVSGYGKRIAQAELDFSDIERKGFNRADRDTAVGAKVLPFIGAETQDMRRQSQAERNFINATLRRESGAAISQTEFTSGEQQYFPRAGDGPDVLAQKKRNRAQVLESFKAEAGPAWKKSKLITKESQASGGLPGISNAEASSTNLADAAAMELARRRAKRK